MNPRSPEFGDRIRVVGGLHDGLLGWYEGLQGTTGYLRVEIELPGQEKPITALVTEVELELPPTE